MKTIIFTIILAIVISFSSTAFATDKRMDLSEKTGVMGWIIKGNAENYIKKFNIPFKMKNIRIDCKNSKRNRYGADIKSYLIIAEIELEGYEEYKYEMAFYVYTGETKNAQTYYVDGFIAEKADKKMYSRLRRYIKKHRKMVEENTAFVEASLELM